MQVIKRLQKGLCISVLPQSVLGRYSFYNCPHNIISDELFKVSNINSQIFFLSSSNTVLDKNN